MSAYIIEGGHPLDGSVRIHGAKNSVLPILAACLLAPGECVIHNCPELRHLPGGHPGPHGTGRAVRPRRV